MRNIPPVKSVMTAFPYWVDIEDLVSAAKDMMSEHDISHLPVKEKGELAGVIALHDIDKIHTYTPDNDISQIKVREVCVLEPYVVTLDEPLDNVLVHMANHHIGSVLVTKNDRLAGVFTMHDACRGFAEDLRYQFRKTTGNDIA